MAKQATITTITAGHTSASKINANFAALNTAFDNTISRDGSTPNTMSVDFDMNNKDILNAGDISAVDLTIGGISVAAQAAAADASATAAGISETNAAADAALTAADVISTAADAVATAADLVLTDADQVSSASSASAASTSETNASSSETAAGVSETNAASSESAAASSETAAGTSATNAATSETNAATSETNAADLLDQFDDRYLGDKASDPSLDNDGNALLTGALYFNTTSDQMRVYDGAAWGDVAPGGGTVTSVGIADAGATEITVVGSPVTGAGEMTLAIATIAGTKIGFSGGGDVDAAVVTLESDVTTLQSGKQAADATLTSIAAVAGVAGDILIATATDVWARLAKDTDDQVLTLVSGLPVWADAVGGATVVFKIADETVTGTTTLQDDDHLLFAMAANTSYAVDLLLLLLTTDTTPDFKIGWAVPSGCTMFWENWSNDAWGGGGSALLKTESADDAIFTVVGTQGTMYRAIVRNAATAGNLQLQWAQNTADGSNSKILKHSYMIIRNLGAT